MKKISKNELELIIDELINKNVSAGTTKEQEKELVQKIKSFILLSIELKFFILEEENENQLKLYPQETVSRETPKGHNCIQCGFLTWAAHTSGICNNCERSNAELLREQLEHPIIHDEQFKPKNILSKTGFELSEQQSAIVRAVTSDERRNIIVTARAGCGKTTTAIEAIEAYLTKNPTHKVMYTSFARRIVDETSEKLIRRGLSVDCNTYHSFGNLLIQSNLPDYRSEGKNTYSTNNAIKTFLFGVQKKTPRNEFVFQNIVINLIDKVKSLFTIEKCGSSSDLYNFILESGIKYNILPEKMSEPEIKKACELAMRGLNFSHSQRCYNVNDMIFLPNIKQLKSKKYDLILVDECQDTSDAMLTIARNLLKDEGVFVAIGDDKQAIYGWNGANSKSLQDLKTKMKANELFLTGTRRCPKNTVEYVKNWVPDFKTFTTTEGKSEIISESKIIELASPKSYILSRSNAPLVPILFQLLKEGKQARIYGKEIGEQIVKKCEKIIKEKDCNTILEFVFALDEISTTALASIEWIEEKNPDLFKKKCEAIEEERDFLKSFFMEQQDLPETLEKITSLFTDEQGNFIILSTIHKIKGLETDKIFILSDTFKNMKSDEEKNILYVALTRTTNETYFVNNKITL